MLETTVALLFFLFPLAYSPGPGNMFFAANGARFGVRATIPANAGYHMATWIVTVAIGLGFAAAMTRWPLLAQVIRQVGAAYVLYLAWKLFRAGAPGWAGAARPAGFGTGALLLLLNPKAYLIITLVFGQFLTGQGFDRVTAVLWISTVFTLNNLLAFLLFTYAGDRLGRMAGDARGARQVNRVFGVALAAVAVWMAVG